MRAILVGPPRLRARLRSRLDGLSVEIVGEFLTVAEARASGAEVDAIILAPATQDGGRTPSASVGDDEAEFAEPLTPREIEVLELLAEGLPNKAIAHALGISDQTVKFHVSSIAGKLGAANRTDIVRRAVRRGLIAL
jgi:DNA-binding NarL/FixJ family response regulator